MKHPPVHLPEAALARVALVLDSASGKRIRELRKQKRVSQMELASRVGLDQSAVSRLERMGAPATLISLQDWCEALDSSPSDLLGVG